jgi:predicted component of type VI protein secretion system
MRSLRSAVAVLFTVGTMACQTVAPTLSAGAAPTAQVTTGAQTNPATQSRAEAVTVSRISASAADAKKNRTIWIIVGVVAAIVIAALLISGGGSDSVY